MFLLCTIAQMTDRACPAYSLTTRRRSCATEPRAASSPQRAGACRPRSSPDGNHQETGRETESQGQAGRLQGIAPDGAGRRDNQHPQREEQTLDAMACGREPLRGSVQLLQHRAHRQPDPDLYPVGRCPQPRSWLPLPPTISDGWDCRRPAPALRSWHWSYILSPSTSDETAGISSRAS
jgi:hypothetical protein